MQKNQSPEVGKPVVSKVQLAFGAASLFLFLVGVKRSFRMDDSAEVHDDPAAAHE
jgi:hypothetical protein